VILLRQVPKAAGESAAQPISQATAATILIMILGIVAFLFFTGRLRSRAAMVAILMVCGVLAYFSFWTNPVLAP